MAQPVLVFRVVDHAVAALDKSVTTPAIARQCSEIATIFWETKQG
jgi:hypothetical protein